MSFSSAAFASSWADCCDCARVSSSRSMRSFSFFAESTCAMIRPTRSALAASSASCCCSELRLSRTLVSDSKSAVFWDSSAALSLSMVPASSLSLLAADSCSALSSNFEGCLDPPPRTKERETQSPSTVMMFAAVSAFESKALAAWSRLLAK